MSSNTAAAIRRSLAMEPSLGSRELPGPVTLGQDDTGPAPECKAG